ncbi:ribose-phosphate pyrophosphokinase [Candidatus Woesearchaeota archaeon]|jgi:ribose-phosphate pyrophosphokinase|nr:ribose-phosphate pyrophosphokinase [Candidatus Woesearchaeota archaeon]
MRLFYTNTSKHLAQRINIRQGKFTVKKFSDGEIYIKIKEQVKNKPVLVLASIVPSEESVLELLFLLDALKREKAKINLLIPYLGYSRQDRRMVGESLSSKVVCDLLKQVKKINIIHVHSSKLKKFLSYNEIIPLKIYYPIIKKYDVIVAPDKGASNLVKKISQNIKIPFTSMEKVRVTPKKVKIIKVKGEVKNKKVLIIDDMISTAGTIIAASKTLQQAGAKEVSVLATHGIFSDKSIERIEKSQIKKVYVTNSLQQKHGCKKVKVIDISKVIGKMFI